MSDRRTRSQVEDQPGGESALRPGDCLGRYDIAGLAGRGTTSLVYRARRGPTFEPLAVKVLDPHLVADPGRRKRFFREARLMLRLDHANVVQFHEILEVEGRVGFVMEYIDGATLADWFSDEASPVELETAVDLFVDILRGVAHAHQNGVIHRDLKPANIMITERDGGLRAKIIDFGVSRARGEDPTERDREKVVGTPAYISPEEVRDPEAVCASSDLYSLGVMMFEAVCGRRPFAEETSRALLSAHARKPPPAPRTLNPALPAFLEEVILKTLEKRPNARFGSAGEMIGALEQYVRRVDGGAAESARGRAT